jgi:uncharacterized protein
MLNSLVERVNATKLTEKDEDAERLLARGFASNPDAVYVLSQSVLVQNIALEQAKQQLTEAHKQIGQLQQGQQAGGSGSFLGSLLGHHAPTQTSQTAVQPVSQAVNSQAPGYQQVYSPQSQPVYETPYNPPPPPYQGQPYPGQPYQGQAYPPPYPPPYAGGGYPPPYPPPPYGGGSSFLRGAAQTAAGVAAGALAFEGVEALLHGGFGHPGMGMGMGGWGMPGVGMGMGPGMMGMGYERPIEENVVNNYYDSPGGEHMHGNYEQSGGEHFHESAGDGGGQLADDSWTENSSGNDNSSGGGGDYSSGGDSGSFDSGGGDSGSGGDSGGF